MRRRQIQLFRLVHQKKRPVLANSRVLMVCTFEPCCSRPVWHRNHGLHSPQASKETQETQWNWQMAFHGLKLIDMSLAMVCQAAKQCILRSLLCFGLCLPSLTVTIATAEKLYLLYKNEKIFLHSNMSQPWLNHTILTYKERTDKLGFMAVNDRKLYFCKFWTFIFSLHLFDLELTAMHYSCTIVKTFPVILCCSNNHALSWT